MTPATDGHMHLANRLSPIAAPVVVVTPESPPDRRWFTTRVAIVAVAAVGVALRLIPLLSDRCLWIDEAMLALNLVERSPDRLLQPLDWNQGAPAGFLLLTKSAIMLFGTAEWSFRLVPFIASVLGMIGFAWVARRLLPAEAALLAVALYAVSPFLISYAGECKQYASDAALAVGMFAAALGLLLGNGGTRRWVVLSVVGAMSVWFSHPVAFVLGGIGTALFFQSIVSQDRNRTGACIATIACWLTSFGVCYITCLRQLGNNDFLLDYWAGHFCPLPPTSQGDLMWLADHYFKFLAYPGGLGGTEIAIGGIAAALAVIGVAAMVRDRWPVAVAIIVPGLVALLASGVHLYPFAGRLLLFLVPLMLLAVARGAWDVAAHLQPQRPLAAVVIVGLLLIAPVIESYQSIRHPQRHEQIEPVLSGVRTEMRPGDKVYVYWGAVPAFLFYTRDDPFPPGVILGIEHHEEHTGYRDDLLQFAGEPRVWLIFSHPHQDEELVVQSYADALGRRERVIRQPGAAAFLFNFERQK
jgi:dolichyl-phosphate-mannose-protein mannosyltransferase